MGHAFLLFHWNGNNFDILYFFRQNVNIVKASTYIVIMDTLIALVVGLIIFSITFTAAQEPSKGAGLVFITLPAIFMKWEQLVYF